MIPFFKHWHTSLHRSAFFLFCADFRPKVKGEHPGLSIGDTAKKLGEMWNSSSAEDKQPYEKKAAKLKEKYDKVNGPCKTFIFIFRSTNWKVSFYDETLRFSAQHLTTRLLCSPQDIVAYRTKGKVDTASAATADDDDDEEEDEEEGEEEDDDDDDEDDE